MNITPTRVTGLATGMDTDAMVKQMMQPYNLKLDKMQQDRQLILWRQEMYRDIIGDINTFKNGYFDVLKGDSYMLSENTFSQFSIDGISGSDVKVQGTSGAISGKYTLSVSQIAEKAKAQGTTAINKIVGAASNAEIKIDNNNNSISLKLSDGTTANLDIPIDSVKGYNRYGSVDDLVKAINTEASKVTVGTDKLSDRVKAVNKNGEVQFEDVTKILNDNKITFAYGGKDYEVSVDEGNYTGEELASKINSKLQDLKSKDGTSTFPKDISVEAETTTSGTSFKFSDGAIANIKNNDKSIDLGFISINSIESGDANDTGISSGTLTNSFKVNPKIIEGFNDSLTVRVGNEIKSVKLPSGIAPTDSDFIDKLNSSLVSAGISGDDLTLSLVDGKIGFTSTSGKQISLFGNASKVFGAYDNFEVNMSFNEKMSNLINSKVKFRINDSVFEYDFGSDYSETNPTGAKDKTISSILYDIKSKTGVDITYSESSKKFTLTSKDTGLSSSIYIEDSEGSFFKTILGDKAFSDTDPTANSKTFSGKDAEFTLENPNGDTTTYSKDKNSFTIDGVNYTLNSKPASDVSFTINSDTEGSFKKIKDFIGKYNELIDKINTKITEKRNYSYSPLTSAQKKDMSDDEIEKWETKVKAGLVRNDSDLENMLSQLRGAFFPKVDGVDINLRDIGLNTSSDYTQKGKIVINESKLKEALKNRGDEVSKFFAKKSISYSRYSSSLTASDRKTRYNEEGIFQRLNDVIQDFTRTTGGKGILLQKSGISGDFTDINNTLSKYLKDKDKAIKEMQKKLFDRENKYYTQFAALEKAMNQLNSQSNWLMQQFSQGQ
ncbi:flagellar filament capping protein FliD [Haloimpatiens sp. FM7315]|uniref:flagellar filament capping protein FliD n=1 Tax=Haloimpatiens sp. FM7315 TaxID=3298609 RepID=UPI0035A34F02